MGRYEIVYNKLIERAINRILPKEIKVEIHHIIPKSLGGSNDKSNLVALTLKEHFIAHLLLTKIYPNEPKMIKAFSFMCRKNPNKRAEDFKVLKEKVNHLMKLQAIEYNSKPESREANSKRFIELWKSEEYRQKQKDCKTKIITPEYKEKRSKDSKKLHEDPEFSARIYKSIEHHSKNKSLEWIEKITIINKQRANTKESKLLASEKYNGSNFDNRRKVLDISTNIVYDSAMDAAKAKNLKYEVVKKWLYKGIPKHNLKWLDLEENNEN